MSTFVLKRNYGLQLPMSFVDVDREEMEYVDGGEIVSVYVQGIWLRRFMEFGCAAVGAAIGSAVPGLGTIAGAAVGGLIGALLGSWFADKTLGQLNMNAYYRIGQMFIPWRENPLFI
ncbi:MAG: glycine zipper domain-containing protein [Clostridium sp.]